MNGSHVARRVAKEAFALADRFRTAAPGPRILIYHQVGAGLGREMEVTLDAFRSQMDWLAQNAQVVSLDEAWRRRAEPAADRLVVLTFDDGYRDTVTAALPVLENAGFPFTVYLATESVDSGVPLSPHPEAAPVTWDEVEVLLSSGLVTIGSHTHTHMDLRHASGDQIEEELGASDALIASRTGQVSRHFAYPWGYWAELAHPLVAARYETATLGGGSAVTGATGPHVVNRIPVQLSDSMRTFGEKLRTLGSTEEWVRRRLRGYSGP